MKTLLGFLCAVVLVGCATDKVAQDNAQRAEGVTIDQKIADVEKDETIPADVKAKLLGDLRQQQAAKKGTSPSGG